jgi:hypothetical protein
VLKKGREVEVIFVDPGFVSPTSRSLSELRSSVHIVHDGDGLVSDVFVVSSPDELRC